MSTCFLLKSLQYNHLISKQYFVAGKLTRNVSSTGGKEKRSKLKMIKSQDCKNRQKFHYEDLELLYFHF